MEEEIETVKFELTELKARDTSCPKARMWDRKSDKRRIIKVKDIENVIEICHKLETLDFVTSVEQIGSRVKNNADCYSDIDLIVNIQDIRPDIALLEITDFMKTTYKPLWIDFANSLMPQKFLVSMFIDCENPFCFLDIGIYNDKVFCYSQQAFQNDKWVHLTKLWVMNFKYYLRKEDCFHERFEKMMGQGNIGYWKNELDGFEKLLRKLSNQNTVDNTYIHKLQKVFEETYKPTIRL